MSISHLHLLFGRCRDKRISSLFYTQGSLQSSRLTFMPLFSLWNSLYTFFRFVQKGEEISHQKRSQAVNS
jgi:hypothetical protein